MKNNVWTYILNTLKTVLLVGLVLVIASETGMTQTERPAAGPSSHSGTVNAKNVTRPTLVAQNPAENRTAAAIPNNQTVPNTEAQMQTGGGTTQTGPAQVSLNNQDSGNDSLTEAEKVRLQEAIDKFNQQDVAGTLEILKDMRDKNSKMVPPRLIVARWFAQLRNTNAVRVSLEMATEESPDDPEAYLLLAEIALRQGELTAGELLLGRGEEYLKNYNVNPQRQKSLYLKLLQEKLLLAQARKHWPDAQNILMEIMKQSGATPELSRQMGGICFNMDQPDKAREWFLHADQLAEGKGLPADAMMAQLYIARGDMAQARTFLDTAQKNNPKSIDVLLLSITMALNENDLNGAWDFVQKLYREDPKSPDVLKTYGKVALFRSDYVQAELALQEAVRLSPADSDAVNGLALALCEQDDQDKKNRAVQYAMNNLQKQENNREYLSTLGWVLYRNGQTDQAIQVLQQSIADGQVNSVAAYYIAVILIEKDQKEQAKQLLRAAVQSTLPFYKRDAAKTLLDSLGK